MKRTIIILLFFSVYILTCVARNDITSSAKKRVKEITKQGWRKNDPTGPELVEQLINQWRKLEQSSQYDTCRKAYLVATQIASSQQLDDAISKAQNACYSDLATLVKSEIAAITKHYMESISKDRNTSTNISFTHVMGSNSNEWLQHVEPGIILYRKVKNVYEVQATYMLCTDSLKMPAWY